MLVTVVGGTGFIGGHVVDQLVSRGHRVRTVSRGAAGAGLQTPGVTHVQCNIALPEGRRALPRLMEGCDCVVHLATSRVPGTAEADAVGDVAENLVPLVAVLDAMSAAQVRRLVYASSGGTVYGRPVTLPIPESHPLEPIGVYGAGKVAAEAYIRLYAQTRGLSAVVVRPSNPYGARQVNAKGQGLVSTLLRAALSDSEVDIWGDGSAVRDYLFVRDLARLFVLAVETDIRGTFNAGSGTGTSVREMIDLVSGTSGRTIRVRYRPGRAFDTPVSILDTALVRGRFGWSAEVGLADGLAQTWDWMRSAPR